MYRSSGGDRAEVIKLEEVEADSKQEDDNQALEAGEENSSNMSKVDIQQHDHQDIDESSGVGVEDDNYKMFKKPKK